MREADSDAATGRGSFKEAFVIRPAMHHRIRHCV
jgi:hypothetical protein